MSCWARQIVRSLISFYGNLILFNRMFPLGETAARCRLLGVTFIVACTAIVSVTLAAAQRANPKPTLVAGSKVNLASITEANWIQGKGPASFEFGKVYMFECWATWCGPCIELIPHVNELHDKYYDKGLRVYGIACWEKEKAKVEKFVQEKGAGMSYPVAYAGEGSSFETNWLTAAGVEAIPYAFIVEEISQRFASKITNFFCSLII